MGCNALMVFMKLKRGSLARQSKPSSHHCLGNHFTKEVMPSTLTCILVEIPALLTTRCCSIPLVGSGSTQSCGKGWGLTSRETPAGNAADGQARCIERLPGWKALLHEPLLTKPSSSLEGCQRHSGTELLDPSGLLAPHNRAFSAGEEQKHKQKGHSAYFLHLLFFLKHMC